MKVIFWRSNRLWFRCLLREGKGYPLPSGPRCAGFISCGRGEDTCSMLFKKSFVSFFSRLKFVCSKRNFFYLHFISQFVKALGEAVRRFFCFVFFAVSLKYVFRYYGAAAFAGFASVHLIICEGFFSLYCYGLVCAEGIRECVIA